MEEGAGAIMSLYEDTHKTHDIIMNSRTYKQFLISGLFSHVSLLFALGAHPDVGDQSNALSAPF
jgi:hypothetical protein